MESKILSRKTRSTKEMERILKELNQDELDELEEQFDECKYFVEDLQQKLEDQCSGVDDRTGFLDDIVNTLKQIGEADPTGDATQDLKPVIQTLEQLSMEIMDCGTFQDLQMMEILDWFKYKE